METIDFKEEFHTWLAQPLEWDERNIRITDWIFQVYWNTKEEIFEKYDIKTWYLIKEYRWRNQDVMDAIEWKTPEFMITEIDKTEKPTIEDFEKSGHPYPNDAWIENSYNK